MSRSAKRRKVMMYRGKVSYWDEDGQNMLIVRGC